MYPIQFKPHEIADPLRRRIVEEALSWRDTPYRLMGRVKGAGVDCGTLLYCVLANTGLLGEGNREIERYRHDWFCNTLDERYERRLLRCATRIARSICTRTLEAQPGDLALTKAVGSPVFNHGGIVLQWPFVIHACAPKVAVVDAMNDFLWQYRQIELFEVNRPKDMATEKFEVATW